METLHFKPTGPTKPAIHIVQNLEDESGVTAIEYGLIAALISIAIIGALTSTSVNLIAIYDFWSAAVIEGLT